MNNLPNVACAVPPAVMLVDGSYWPCSARLAIRFSDLGARVVGVCPTRGHPLPGTAGLDAVYEYPVQDTAAALVALIEAEKPDLIVVCDDHALVDLQHAHARARSQANAFVASRIERSMGDPRAFPAMLSRGALLTAAEQEGVRAVPSRDLPDEAALAAWQADHPFPFVLKRDGTSGGTGVVVAVSPAEALSAFRQLSRPLGLMRALKNRVVNRDRFAMREWRRAERGRVSVQPFVAGRPGNCAVACWQGEVVAFLAVEALHTQGPTSAATIVRLIDSPDMRRAAERIVRRLGLSGFCGFDFIIENGTGLASLIEMNPRITMLCTLAGGAGGDPVAALMGKITGAACHAASTIGENPLVAYFPHAWQQGAPADLLRTTHHDVPWSDPGLVRRLCDRPYPVRGLLARLLGGVLGKQGPRPVDMAQFADRIGAQDAVRSSARLPSRVVESV
ncbi:MAG TPA: ATP-grasp domain-containing protein [Rhodopila sp.]|uniref:ATP-binding protein n=1 Tax=Rhodopila sp. TaxID=2480087 RepID=UPI002BE6D6C6|nr:ATP-grasp domain-containing protein [Rhodopila sp.]HVY15173.1 ATP-grasp domain-containing protein [Rhodopila sp.]